MGTHYNKMDKKTKMFKLNQKLICNFIWPYLDFDDVDEFTFVCVGEFKNPSSSFFFDENNLLSKAIVENFIFLNK